MAIERKGAPYAPPSNVIAIVRRFRERNLPDVIDVDLLLDVGISKGNVHRTLAALEFLGLIQEDGTPTTEFHTLQISTDEEYLNIMGSLVQHAYKDVFNVVDPSKDSQSVIDNHFRRYQPTSQRGRMVTLFLALCREAGISTLDAPRERTIRAQSGAAGRSKAPPQRRTAPANVTSAKIAAPTTPLLNMQNLSVADLRASYIAALIEQVRQSAAHGRDIDTDLLDRIERLMAEDSLASATSESFESEPED